MFVGGERETARVSQIGRFGITVRTVFADVGCQMFGEPVSVPIDTIMTGGAHALTVKDGSALRGSRAGGLMSFYSSVWTPSN